MAQLFAAEATASAVVSSIFSWFLMALLTFLKTAGASVALILSRPNTFSPKNCEMFGVGRSTWTLPLSFNFLSASKRSVAIVIVLSIWTQNNLIFVSARIELNLFLKKNIMMS